MVQKRQGMAEKPKGISENVDMSLSKDYANLSHAKSAIKTLSKTSLKSSWKKEKGKPAQFGSSARDWYSGWIPAMSTLLEGDVTAQEEMLRKPSNNADQRLC